MPAKPRTRKYQQVCLLRICGVKSTEFILRFQRDILICFKWSFGGKRMWGTTTEHTTLKMVGGGSDKARCVLSHLDTNKVPCAASSLTEWIIWTRTAEKRHRGVSSTCYVWNGGSHGAAARGEKYWGWRGAEGWRHGMEQDKTGRPSSHRPPTDVSQFCSQWEIFSGASFWLNPISCWRDRRVACHRNRFGWRRVISNKLLHRLHLLQEHSLSLQLMCNVHVLCMGIFFFPEKGWRVPIHLT